MSSKYKFLIAGMHCGACVRRVASSLEGIEGVSLHAVEVGSANISLDPQKTSLQQVVYRLERIGFHATLES